MRTRSWKLIAADESAIVAEPFFNAIVVEDDQGNGSFADPTCTDESDWSEGFHEANNLLDQVIAPEASSWPRRRRLSGNAGLKRKVLGWLTVEITNPV